MAHHIINGSRNHNLNSRRPSSIAVASDNQIVQDAYDYEMKKLIEHERQIMLAQVYILYE